MTAKEAITLLQSRGDLIKKDYPDIEDYAEALEMAIEALSAQGQESDLISREAAIAEFSCCELTPDGGVDANYVIDFLERLPPAQPEQRYTKEELRVFQHGISLSLLSKKSAQHWRYDEDTATEIEFLERLYDKVSADMRGEHDGKNT